jgi:hypothetical protein
MPAQDAQARARSVEQHGVGTNVGCRVARIAFDDRGTRLPSPRMRAAIWALLCPRPLHKSRTSSPGFGSSTSTGMHALSLCKSQRSPGSSAIASPSTINDSGAKGETRTVAPRSSRTLVTPATSARNVLTRKARCGGAFTPARTASRAPSNCSDQLATIQLGKECAVPR